MLVDRVATKSTDSREEWGRTAVRRRSGQRVYGTWLEVLPCLRSWNMWCYFYIKMYDFGPPADPQIDIF